ncbi:MAG: ABC transporter ATP-binding protein [Anaerolineae bacterium]
MVMVSASDTSLAPSPGIWKQLGSILYPRRVTIAWIGLTVIAGAALEIVPPLVMLRIIDDHLAIGRAEGILPLAALYLGATGLAQGFGFLTSYLTALAAQGALHDLRVRLFAHLQRLPMSFHDQNPLGDIVSRCTADAETVNTLFSSGVASLMTDLLRLASSTVTMVVLSPVLSAAVLVLVPPLVIITNYLRVHVRDAERGIRLATGRLNAQLHEILGGIEVIRAFGRESVFVHRFRLVLRDWMRVYNASALYSTLYPPVMATVSAFAQAFLLWVGTSTLFPGWHITLGTLTAFVLLFRRFIAPITAIGDEWQTVQGAIAGAERIFQVLELPVEEQPVSTVQAIRADGFAPVEMRDVVFGYLPGQPVLHGISLQVHSGEQVALVGRTGAGKSSTLHLLGGLYTPWSGLVRVDGVDPRLLSSEERRKVVGVVPQLVQLFSGTILDNLTLGDGTVPREAVERAAQLTGADAFIATLPQGYDTWLGQSRRGGVQLSAGQRQLLSLTRALVWDPPVLLLDEATALVDNASDAAFRAALRASAHDRDRAVLIVAHRLATARETDRVIVLDAGRIIESGEPADLVRRGGRFAALLDLEAAGWDWRNGLTGRGRLATE